MEIVVGKDGKNEIYDPVRKKYVVLTPEEGVRQFVIGFLRDQCHVPLGYISVETSMQVYGKSFRADLRVRDRSGKAVLIVECKRPSVPLGNEVLEQVMKYRLSDRERFVLITNGREFRCYERCPETGNGGWKEWDRYPCWDEINAFWDRDS